MAENCSRRSLQFQNPDPLSREAISRTTRYRIIKKRKAEEELETSSADLLLPDNVDSQDLQCAMKELPFVDSANEHSVEGEQECEHFVVTVRN